MTRYMTRRREVEAVKWLGGRFDGEAPPWVLNALLEEGVGKVWRKDSNLHISTPDTPQIVRAGAWLVRLDTGKLMAMSDQEFKLTYEAIPEPVEVEEVEVPRPVSTMSRRRLSVPLVIPESHED